MAMQAIEMPAAPRPLAQRKLDHGQYLVLTERIDDLQRGHRMSIVDERLSFLPHGMVKRLEAMLADAQVTGWERHHSIVRGWPSAPGRVSRFAANVVTSVLSAR